MAGRWRTQDGCWSVEVVTLSHTPDYHDGQWIRVRRWGYFIADVRSPADLAQYVALEELLEEALPDTGRRCLAPGRACAPAAPAFPPAGPAAARRPGPDLDAAGEHAAGRRSGDALLSSRWRRGMRTARPGPRMAPGPAVTWFRTAHAPLRPAGMLAARVTVTVLPQ